MKLYEPEKETSLKEMICSEMEFRKYMKSGEEGDKFA